MTLDEITQKILQQIDEKGFKQRGAFNLRHNGTALCHGDSEHIKIRKKEDKPGIDVYIDGDTKGEQVHIPVVVDASGMTDVVYNDFYIARGAEVKIVAGCGIHNSGCNESRHEGSLRSSGAGGSTTAAATRAATTAFIPSTWRTGLMCATRKSITERAKGLAPGCLIR